SDVICNCSFNNCTVCHVTSIKLRDLVPGYVLPAEFGNLLYLQTLDLRKNQLKGALPDSLGNLSSLQTMIISSNNFSGSIPNTFGNLKNLQFL
ncbi:hypothetical protein Nepgr_030987, partial [Nepenthes gracilis]